MAEIHEYFSVTTEGGRHYLCESVNAAHAAYQVETAYQERVIDVRRVVYHKVILVQGAHHAPEATDQATNTKDTPESTGSEDQHAETAEKPEGTGS